MFQSLVNCVNCNKGFTISSENVFKHEYKTAKGNTIWLTYYDCPRCGKRHYVQVDSVRTHQLLQVITRQMAYFASCRKKGKPIRKSASADYERNKTHLSEIRMDMMKQLEGSEVLDPTTKVKTIVRF